MEHECDKNANCILCTWNNSKNVWEKKLKDFEISGDDPDHSIIKIGFNIGESWKLAVFSVSQTSMRNHQLMLV